MTRDGSLATPKSKPCGLGGGDQSVRLVDNRAEVCRDGEVTRTSSTIYARRGGCQVAADRQMARREPTRSRSRVCCRTHSPWPEKSPLSLRPL